MKTNETNAQMIERLQVAESLSSASFALNILMLVGLVLTIVYLLNKIKKVEGKYVGVQPTQEGQNEMKKNKGLPYSVQDETRLLRSGTFEDTNPLLQTLPIDEEQNGSNNLDGSNQGTEEDLHSSESSERVNQQAGTEPIDEEQNGSNDLDGSNQDTEEDLHSSESSERVNQRPGTEPFKEDNNGTHNLLEHYQPPESDLHRRESTDHSGKDRRGGSRT